MIGYLQEAIQGGLFGVPFGALGGLAWAYLYRRGYGTYGMGIALIFYFAFTQMSLSVPASAGRAAFLAGMWGMGALVKLVCWRLYRHSVEEGGPMPS